MIYNIEDLRQLPEKYGIRKQLENLISRIEIGNNLQIWPDEAQEEFKRLANSMLNDYDVHKILDNVSGLFEILDTNLTKHVESLSGKRNNHGK